MQTQGKGNVQLIKCTLEQNKPIQKQKDKSVNMQLNIHNMKLNQMKVRQSKQKEQNRTKES